MMYRNLLAVAVLSTVIFGCSPKNVFELNEVEQRKLNEMLDARNQCLISQAAQVDDGVTDATKIAEIAISKCAFYEDNIQNTLIRDFGMKLGPAWSYVNNLRMQAPNEVTEAILANRKAARQR